MSVKFIHPSGNCSSGLVIIGEAPGEQEDLEGRPFVGRSGKLLDKFLNLIGLNRTNVYVTNIVKVRPPDNRTPTRDELASWKPILIKELNSLEGAKVIMTLGGCSTKTLLDTEEPISSLRGLAYRLETVKPLIVPTFHPSFLLRQSANVKIQEQCNNDFLLVERMLK